MFHNERTMKGEANINQMQRPLLGPVYDRFGFINHSCADQQHKKTK